MFPLTYNGSIYFFNTNSVVEENEELQEAESTVYSINNANLEFALTEIFNFYARKYMQKPSDFE